MPSGEAFGKQLIALRTERGLSASQLAERMFVSKSTVSRWENGYRMPDLTMLSRLAVCLGVPYTELLDAATVTDEVPTILLAEDEPIILQGTLAEVCQLLPEAAVYGFTSSARALQFARGSRVDLALIDIELGKDSGLTLCRELCEINPRTNVIFLTGYPGYAQEAWSTEASGFLVKPLRREALFTQLRRLRFPIPGYPPTARAGSESR